MISAHIVGDQAFLNRLHRLAGGISPEIEKGMLRSVIKLQGMVKRKLSDQVLHVRTGTLRRSINYAVRTSGQQVIGIVGTNVSYAAAHEYGFNGVVNVREHIRHLKSGSIAQVRGHSRHMVLPVRSFLRSSLEEFMPEFKLEMQDAVKRARGE